MIVGSRGIGAREKHIIMDLQSLLPHYKTEAKIDKMDIQERVRDTCKMNSCQNLLFFEQRKQGKHLYLWMGKSPKGPSAKFTVENTHTTRELKMIGNCLRYSRPLLSFDKAFDTEPQLKVMKEIFIDTFNAPRNHPKTKPFVDHVFNFTWANDRIWFRNYQIFREEGVTNKASSEYELIEIGPRFSLCPIKIFTGFLGGEVMYANPNYVAPRMINRQRNREMEKKFLKNKSKKDRREGLIRSVLPTDDIDHLYDNENFDDLKEKKNHEDDDSDQYEENDDDYEE